MLRLPLMLKVVAIIVLAIAPIFPHAATVYDEKRLFSQPIHDIKNLNDQPQLQQIIGLLSSTNRVRSEFQQSKKMKILRRPLISKGSMIYERDQGLYWHIETPFPSTLVVMADRIIQHSDGQVTVMNATENPQAFGFAQVFFQLLAGNFIQLEKKFSLYFSLDKDVGWQLGLIPRNAQFSMIAKKIILQGTDDLNAITLSDASGDITVIQFLQRQVGGVELDKKERAYFAP